MNYSRFFNHWTKQVKNNPLRKLGQQALRHPHMIWLISGNPEPSTFPFQEGKVSLTDGSYLHFDETDFNQALQYSQTYGFPELVKWLKEWQKRVHNPPTFEADGHPGCMDCIVVSGNMDGFSKTIASLVEEGDNVLIEQPAYPEAIDAIKNTLANLLGVDSDGDGINPDSLRQVLSKWDPSDAKDPKSDIPKLLYCCPSAGNPTGARLSMERRYEIYKIAQTYDLIILEDDPYYFLQFSKPIVPSFLSMDNDGRVVRFDSFSKLISAGMRMGFVSGPSPIIDKIAHLHETGTFHGSGLSQMFLYKFLKRNGHDGFTQHLNKVNDFYKQKRDQCVEAAEKHLTGLSEWIVPSGGLFLWIKLLNVKDSCALAEKAIEKGVIVVPGKIMYQAKQDGQCPYIRIAYSSITKDDLDIAFGELAELLRKESN